MPVLIFELSIWICSISSHPQSYVPLLLIHPFCHLAFFKKFSFRFFIETSEIVASHKIGVGAVRHGPVVTVVDTKIKETNDYFDNNDNWLWSQNYYLGHFSIFSNTCCPFLMFFSCITFNNVVISKIQPILYFNEWIISSLDFKLIFSN